MTEAHKEIKYLHCPICCTQARVAAVSLDQTPDVVVIELECMSCGDHLGTSVRLPLEVIDQYELPEIGSNIYNPIKTYLKKRGERKDDNDEEE